MKAFETSATVQDEGRVQLNGLPFAPGTQVAVTISPAEAGPEAAGRVERLLAALAQARNTQSVSSFKRAELYDRSVLR